MSWSAAQYVTFEDERTRPARDLLHAVPNQDVRSAIDLGCGPGNSTELLAVTFPGAIVSGLDSSPDMIEAARARLPNLRFDIGSIESWDGQGAFDLVFSNATLHWVQDHASLFPRLLAGLRGGGSLAVQMPDNLDEPSHRLMREIAAEGPWREKLAHSVEERAKVETAHWYHALLRPLCRRVDVWRTTYHHPLAGGPDTVVEWFKGSALRPFLAPLQDDERQAFLARYRAAISDTYPQAPDGAVLLPFPRLFAVATL